MNKWSDPQKEFALNAAQNVPALPAQKAIPQPLPIFQRLLALAVLFTTAWCVADYPYARLFLSLLLTAFAISLLFWQSLWLMVIPAVLPLVNLAPWSGRFFLEDFDFFIWVAIASALWHGDYTAPSRPRLAKTPWLLAMLFLTAHSIALLRGLWPLAAIDGNVRSSNESSIFRS